MSKEYITKPSSYQSKLVPTKDALKKIAASFDKARQESMAKSGKSTNIDFVNVK